MKKGFEGWYFRHQIGDETIAFIPGRANSGSFVQVIDTNGSKQYDIHDFRADKNCIMADGCVLSERGVIIDLPDIKGEVGYGELTPLHSDIMGPFRFLPLECRHGVISMSHALSGKLNIYGTEKIFDGGRGYIEKDSGASFPSDYLWLQCNDFPSECSIMLSIANIPFAGAHFTGCICALLLGREEYRFATYSGVRVLEAGKDRVILSQGKLKIEADIISTVRGHDLQSPIRGNMTGVIRENNSAGVHLRFWVNDKLLFSETGCNAGLECTGKYDR